VRRVFDWLAIRAAFERGMTPVEIAREIPQSPSRQAIEKRSSREGWDVAKLQQRTVSEPQGDRHIVLSSIRRGANLTLAAAAAGISDRTLRQWREDDETFDTACKAAKAAFIVSREQVITDAGDRGDWKAAAYQLERDPLTKDQYGQKNDPSVQIILNISREDPKDELPPLEHSGHAQ
jgi:hypothetical protein